MSQILYYHILVMMVYQNDFDTEAAPSLGLASSISEDPTIGSSWVSWTNFIKLNASSYSTSANTSLFSPLLSVPTGATSLFISFPISFNFTDGVNGMVLTYRFNTDPTLTILNNFVQTPYNSIITDSNNFFYTISPNLPAWSGQGPDYAICITGNVLVSPGATHLVFVWTTGFGTSGFSDIGAFLGPLTVTFNNTPSTIYNFTGRAPSIAPYTQSPNPNSWRLHSVFSSLNAAYIAVPGTNVTENNIVRLMTDEFSIPANNQLVISFMHLWDLGNLGDPVNLGGPPLNRYTLEISTDNGSSFQEITAAGGSFIQNGYNNTNFWSGSSIGIASSTYINTIAILPTTSTTELNLAFTLNYFNTSSRLATFGIRVAHIVITATNLCVHPDMEVDADDGKKILVKNLKPGDVLKTNGPGKKIKVLVNHINDIASDCQIRFETGSISSNVPSKPLILTSNLPIMIDNKFVKPQDLINDTTIKRIKGAVCTHTIVTNNGKPIMIHGVPISTWNIRKWVPPKTSSKSH